MTDRIHIIFYPSEEDIAKELINRLKQDGREIVYSLLKEGMALTTNNIDKQACLNILILSQENMESMKLVDWPNFPRNNSISKENGLSIAFCINCSETIPSLNDCFLIEETKDSVEAIRRGIVQYHNRYLQTSKGRYGFFVGRNNEIDQFQNLLYSENASHTNVLIVSGRQGVGREAYVRECIRQDKGDKGYEPFTLSMGKSGNIEMFLIQLNSILRSYNESEFIDLLRSGTDEKVKASVKMLNLLFRDGDYLLLYDDGASCVRYNKGLSDWFKSVVTDPMLKYRMRLYVISNIAVSYSRIKTLEHVAFITLYGLTLSDRKKLLYKQLSVFSESLTEDQVQFFADKLVYSPSQLMKVVEDIKTKGVRQVKDKIDSYQIIGDKKILSLVNSYDTPDHPDAKNILVLLSRIEYVSNQILQSIFSDTLPEVEKEIDRFMADGIVERFGEWMDLIRLDSSVSDYIRRNRINYNDRSLQGFVTDKLAELVDKTPKITEDYSMYLEKLKQGVARGRFNEESYLVPSVLVNTISEAYEGKKWNLSIQLCEDILEKRPDYFQDVYKEIMYWYCLSLARTQNGDKFFKNVKQITGADYHFLKGFYLRIGKQYADAENEYGKALTMNPSLSRAKREMVLVLQAQHKFTAALQMAEINYEKDPENAYHIHAYFRCLVRKHNITSDERLLLQQFIKDPNNLFKSKYYIDGMSFEYQRFIDRAKPDVLFEKATVLANKYKDIPYIKDIIDDYYVSQGLQSRLLPIDYSDDFDF